jgi:peptide/nickel transport system permease protein
MLQYIARRIVMMIPTLFLISVVSFIIIQLPPGDFLTSYITQLSSMGDLVDESSIQALKDRYGLGQPIYVQYLRWMTNMLQGDFGHSMEWNRPVLGLLTERLPITFLLAFSTLLFTWAIAFPIGIYSAVKQYSIGDYIATFLGFIGLATPDFLLALIIMWVLFAFFNQSVGGLFSPEFQEAPWSLGKILDLGRHLLVPMVILGLSGTASLIRVMRANLLDELHKPYVVTARAKGLAESKLLLKYPVRAALNPFVSTAGWYLPALVSGSTIVAVVLSLPITGPLLLRALMSQDMYLAGSFIFVLSTLTVIGTLISDILLAWLDPRIRLG